MNGERSTQPRSPASAPAPPAGANAAIDARAPQPSRTSSSANVEVRRHGGDHVPKSLRLEPTPDDTSVAAIMWGPLVLAGDHGPRVEGEGKTADGAATAPPAPPPVPMLVAADRRLGEWLVPAGSRSGDFRVQGVARVPALIRRAPTDVALTPFYRTHRRRYSVYFDVVTPAEFDAKVAALAAERGARCGASKPPRLDSLGRVTMQSEREFNYRSDRGSSCAGRDEGRTNRAVRVGSR